MNRFGLTFHHFGLAVREPSLANVYLEGLGYRIEAPIYDPEQNVNLTMAFHEDMPAVEIIWAAGSAGPLDQYLKKHPKGLVYHLCYVSKDLPKSVQSFEEAGLDPICVSDPKGAILFGGKSVAFYSIKGFGLIEIIAE